MKNYRFFHEAIFVSSLRLAIESLLLNIITLRSAHRPTQFRAGGEGEGMESLVRLPHPPGQEVEPCHNPRMLRCADSSFDIPVHSIQGVAMMSIEL
jgi:hypothetical protein